jgi:hypothetical protein
MPWRGGLGVHLHQAHCGKKLSYDSETKLTGEYVIRSDAEGDRGYTESVHIPSLCCDVLCIYRLGNLVNLTYCGHYI